MSLSDFTVFEEFTVKKHAVNMSFNGDFSPHQDHYCICHGVISGVMFQVYFRELSHKTGLQGDMPDHSTERLFVCLCPTQVLLGPFLSPLTSLSVLRPVGAERLNVMTPFFPLCPRRTLHPINFHSAFTEIPGLSPPALISNTCTKDTKKHTNRGVFC